MEPRQIEAYQPMKGSTEMASVRRMFTSVPSLGPPTVSGFPGLGCLTLLQPKSAQKSCILFLFLRNFSPEKFVYKLPHWIAFLPISGPLFI